MSVSGNLLISLHIFFLSVPINSYNVETAARISSKYFPFCSVITVVTEVNPSDIPEVSDLESYFLSQNSLNFPQVPRHIFGLSSFKTISAFNDIRAYTPYCKVIITFVEGAFNATQFFELITPLEYPISLRDIDHFIFLPKTPDVVPSILLSDVSRELKYKIVLLNSPQNPWKSQLLTFCLFCQHTLDNPRGKNAIVPVTEENLFPEFTKNFHGHLLRVVGPNRYISLLEWEKIEGTKFGKLKRGMYSEFLFILQKKLNFTYNWRPCSGFGKIVPEGHTGKMLPDGRWAGCVSDLLYGWADLSTGGNFADDRLHYVDFTAHMRYDHDQFFTHKPGVVYPWTVVFVAFDLWGWACVFLSVVAGTVLLFKTEDLLHTSGPKVGEVLYNLYANLLGQDLNIEPRSVSSKMTFVYWLYYGIVVGSAYTSSLQSLIVSPGMSVIPGNMEELAAASGWGCGVPIGLRNGLGENIWRSSKNKAMQKLHRESQEDKDARECLKRAATTDYACFHWQIMAEFYMGTIFIDKTGNHPFLYSKDAILFSGPTWIIRKREIWVDTVNNFFIRQFGMGIVHQVSAEDMRNVRAKMVQEVREGKRKPLETFTREDDGPRPFTFTNVKACFIVLFIGLVVSSFSFTREIVPKNFLFKICFMCRKIYLRLIHQQPLQIHVKNNLRH